MSRRDFDEVHQAQDTTKGMKNPPESLGTAKKGAEMRPECQLRNTPYVKEQFDCALSQSPTPTSQVSRDVYRYKMARCLISILEQRMMLPYF